MAVIKNKECLFFMLKIELVKCVHWKCTVHSCWCCSYIFWLNDNGTVLNDAELYT